MVSPLPSSAQRRLHQSVPPPQVKRIPCYTARSRTEQWAEWRGRTSRRRWFSIRCRGRFEDFTSHLWKPTWVTVVPGFIGQIPETHKWNGHVAGRAFTACLCSCARDGGVTTQCGRPGRRRPSWWRWWGRQPECRTVAGRAEAMGHTWALDQPDQRAPSACRPTGGARLGEGGYEWYLIRTVRNTVSVKVTGRAVVSVARSPVGL